MTGFIRGLFRGNKDSETPRSKEAFFLSEDDSKTYGDIDYMRSSKVVKRTFARKKGQTEELESVRQISATNSREIEEYSAPTIAKQASTASFSSSSFSPSTFEKPKTTEAPKFQRRQADDSMDMFRKMAKDLKKR